ncbi:MAG: GNAT family N-acetyltransferase [Acidimicrobiales bacterium]
MTIRSGAAAVSELDNPVWSAVAGPQRDLGTVTPLAACFHPDVSPFGGFPAVPTDEHWRAMAGLLGGGGMVALTGAIGSPPTGWRLLRELPGVQMVCERLRPASTVVSSGQPPKETPVPLGGSDVADMLALAAEARPGPFLPRTVEFGGYVGVRREGRLVAMAGERLQPPGYVEISAVATDPGFRGQGLAELLVRTVASSVVDRGAVPFLHAATDNAGAIRLYERLGFTRRRAVSFVVLEAPADR